MQQTQDLMTLNVTSAQEELPLIFFLFALHDPSYFSELLLWPASYTISKSTLRHTIAAQSSPAQAQKSITH